MLENIYSSRDTPKIDELEKASYFPQLRCTLPALYVGSVNELRFWKRNVDLPTRVGIITSRILYADFAVSKTPGFTWATGGPEGGVHGFVLLYDVIYCFRERGVDFRIRNRRVGRLGKLSGSRQCITVRGKLSYECLRRGRSRDILWKEGIWVVGHLRMCATAPLSSVLEGLEPWYQDPLRFLDFPSNNLKLTARWNRCVYFVCILLLTWTCFENPDTVCVIFVARAPINFQVT